MYSLVNGRTCAVLPSLWPESTQPAYSEPFLRMGMQGFDQGSRFFQNYGRPGVFRAAHHSEVVRGLCGDEWKVVYFLTDPHALALPRFMVNLFSSSFG